MVESPSGASPSGSSPTRRARRRLRIALLAGMAALYAISIPWYRATDAPLVLWLGLPDWVALALGCYVGVALLNSVAWWLTDVDDEEPSATGREPSAAREEPSAPGREPSTTRQEPSATRQEGPDA